MLVARNSAWLRSARVPALLAIAMLGGLAVAPPASAALPVVGPSTECTGTIGAETVGSLDVPDGETCTLDGTTVEGSVTLGEGSSLIADDATITHNVRAIRSPSRIRLIDTDVLLNIMVTGATTKIVIGAEGCKVDPVAGNNVILRDNPAPIAICFMSIGENLTLSGNTGRLGVFDNVVGNNLMASDNAGNAARFRDNVVGVSGGGNLTLTDNAYVERLVLSRNHAGNHIDCDGNTPEPTGSGNSADNGLTGQCAGLG